MRQGLPRFGSLRDILWLCGHEEFGLSFAGSALHGPPGDISGRARARPKLNGWTASRQVGLDKRAVRGDMEQKPLQLQLQAPKDSLNRCVGENVARRSLGCTPSEDLEFSSPSRASEI